MAAPIRPNAAKTFKRESVMYVPVVAAYQTKITVAEATAAANLELAGFLFGDWGRPAQNTNRVTLGRRLMDGSQYEQIGVSNYTGGDLRLAFDPQAVAASAARKAYETLPDGTVGFLMQRLAVNPEVDYATGQRVNLFPVAFGPQMPTPSGDGEEAEAVFMQAFAVTGPPKFDLAISAT